MPQSTGQVRPKTPGSDPPAAEEGHPGRPQPFRGAGKPGEAFGQAPGQISESRSYVTHAEL